MTVSLVQRDLRARGIERTRIRPNASGAFISKRVRSYLYVLRLPETPGHYVHTIPYDHPYPKAYGYIDEPPIVPPWTVMGPLETGVSYPAIPPPPPPPPPPPERKALGPPFLPGASHAFTPGQSPKQISQGTFAIARLTIIAASTNTGTIWVAYHQGVAPGDGFPLVAGAARDFDVNDLGSVWLIGENATDKIYYAYER